MDILFEKVGAVFVISFNRPTKGNAFTGSMAKVLSEKLKSISEDRAIRCVLLRGNGDDFMQGHDLSLFAGDVNAIQDQVFQKVQFFYTAIRDMQIMEKPVICAIHGRVSSAGFNFVLASDLVIAAETTTLSTGFVGDAMVPDGGATFFLPRKVGMGRATELLMLNETFSAKHGKDWGLVSRVVPDEILQSEGMKWAETIATGPTRALGAVKRLVVKSFEQDLNAQLSLEAAFWNNGYKTFDFREAMKAFLSDRDPRFTGS